MSEPLPRVLVVEDEQEIRRFVCLSLEREGFDVYEADAVQRGLTKPARVGRTWSCSTSACPMATG
jgi:CheY-like chemotaxis protein